MRTSWPKSSGASCLGSCSSNRTRTGGQCLLFQPAGALAAAQIAGGSGGRAPVTEAAVREALRDVLDPEIGLSIVQLGLIYGIEVEGGAVAISMTLTAQGCPLHAVMTDWVRQAVSSLPGVERVDVRLTFDPPWSPGRIQR